MSRDFLHVMGWIATAAFVLSGCGGNPWPCTLPCPNQDLLVYWDEQGHEHPVGSEEDWQKRRRSILVNMQSVMGTLPAPHRRVPLDVEILEETEISGSTRRKITFQAEQNDRVPAYLFLPNTGDEKKVPGILCLHQTTSVGKEEPAGIRGNPQLSYARDLAAQGYVTLAPDDPNFGEYTLDPYAHGYESATMKGIWNHIRAVDLLQQLPEVDPDRIGCIGHSLGGHDALFVAVFDTRISVMVSSCGFTSFCKYQGGNLSGWSHRGYMPRIASRYGNDPKRMPFEFSEVVAALAPRPLFVNAPLFDDIFDVTGVADCVRWAAPVYELLEAGDNFRVRYPLDGHVFPEAIRKEAWSFLEEFLASD